MLWIDTSYTQVSQEENGGTQRVTALGIDLCVAREKKKNYLGQSPFFISGKLS